MVSKKYFTQSEIDAAKLKLEDLPDLSPQRITRNEALNELKDTILMLAREKGYSPSDIKSALDSMAFRFSEKSITEIINESEGNKRRRKPRIRQESN